MELRGGQAEACQLHVELAVVKLAVRRGGRRVRGMVLGHEGNEPDIRHVHDKEVIGAVFGERLDLVDLRSHASGEGDVGGGLRQTGERRKDDVVAADHDYIQRRRICNVAHVRGIGRNLVRQVGSRHDCPYSLAVAPAKA